MASSANIETDVSRPDVDWNSFLNCFQDLMLQSQNIKVEMCSDELAKDMPGAIFLLHKHKENKKRIDILEEDFRSVAKAGQKLLRSDPSISDEVKDRMVSLANERTSLRGTWEKRQLLYEQCKDLQKFYQEVEEANSWIDQQQAFLTEEEESLNFDDLLKRQEDLEKAVAAQDEKIRELDQLATKLIQESEISIMEELSEDSLHQRHDWVKFEDGANAKRRREASDTAELRDDVEQTDAAAILPIENQIKKPRNKANGAVADDPLEVSAVIEATQVHVSLDRHTNGTGSAAAAAPTLLATTAPANKAPSPAPRIPRDTAAHVPPPKVPARSAKSEPSSNTAKHSPNTMNLSTIVTPPPLPPASHEMQTVSLADTLNGAQLGTNSVLSSVHSNATRQAFANGDILVTILPQNERCSWMTRAIFRPELVPEELMSRHLTLTVEEYLSAMEILVNDFRFNCYNICYKRILMTWILLSFLVLIVLLFSGMRGVALFGAGVMWLLINASGIFVCMWIKIRLRYHLEGCVAQVNKYLVKHRILMGVDDRGKLSCHKVNLIFIFFDCADCMKRLQTFIENEDKTPDASNAQSADKSNNLHARMDIDNSDVIITGNTYTRIPRPQERGEKLLLRYSQRWVKEYVCKRIDLSIDPYDRQEGEPPIQPRHCVSSRCPCQFIEEHLRFKPRGQFCGCQILDL